MSKENVAVKSEIEQFVAFKPGSPIQPVILVIRGQEVLRKVPVNVAQRFKESGDLSSGS